MKQIMINYQLSIISCFINKPLQNQNHSTKNINTPFYPNHFYFLIQRKMSSSSIYRQEVNRHTSTDMQTSLISRDTISRQQQTILQENVEKNISKNLPSQPTVRLDSLDVYRGFTMFGMIIVDCGGSNMPWYLEHAEWTGLTPADLIFPSFLFIMGMAIPLAVTQAKPLRIKNIARVIALFALGLFMNLYDERFNPQKTRIMGVLQRLSICYGIILLIHFLTRYGHLEKRIFGSLAIFVGFLLYINFMVSYDKPQLGCPKQNNFTKQCNFAAYFDSKILNREHMLRYPNDPEGIFTTLSALVTTYFGYYFSLIMKDHKKSLASTLKRWLVIIILLAITIYPIQRLMPFSKRMYSASFAILTSCIGGASILVFVVLVDVLFKAGNTVRKVTNIILQPFFWLGRNPLFVYFGMTMLENLLGSYIRINGEKGWDAFEKYCFQSWLGETQLASVVFSLFFLVLWTIASGLLYCKGIFIRV